VDYLIQLSSRRDILSIVYQPGRERKYSCDSAFVRPHSFDMKPITALMTTLVRGCEMGAPELTDLSIRMRRIH